MGLELTDKKAKILLGVLRANRPTDVKSLTLRLKKRGDKIHMNYVRRVVDELGKEKLIDVEIYSRGFRRISPKDDIETFKRLAHLFLTSPYKFEFLSLPFTKNKLTDEFLSSLLTAFWTKYGETIKNASDEILNNIMSQIEYFEIPRAVSGFYKKLATEGNHKFIRYHQRVPIRSLDPHIPRGSDGRNKETNPSFHQEPSVVVRRTIKTGNESSLPD
jgi:hypothetical protein